ncbi:lantibiotic dehydratase [Actinoplanes sp. NPDC026670]|uniref:lantibiotic dehydratase n=1 Tax=Actinoplanes sp. NPDC026670 TaxID=3154700 RepID=UPI0033C7CE00
MDTDPLIALGDTRWRLWRESCLRGAGFPADRLAEICDEELATAADLLDDATPGTRDQYLKVFAAAADRLTAAIRRTAGESSFREAVTWQNPALIRDCLDKAVAGEPRNVRGRGHEQTIATYLQRYTLKNDTVGFFGPVGWARIGPEDSGVTAQPGPELLAGRTVYFESWAIDAVADAIAARPEVWPWLRPRVSPSTVMVGATVRLPFRRPVSLSPAEVRVLGRCDGRRSVRDLAGDPLDPAVVGALLRLRDLGVVRIDLGVHLVPWPEHELQDRLDTIGDPVVRAAAREPVDAMIRARDALSAAGGDPDRLLHAMEQLTDLFSALTGRAATRRSGATYAGRTLVYEDTTRAGEVRVGRRVTDTLASSLGPMLDSAVWLANTVGRRYEAKALAVFDREVARTGRPTMPLMQLLTAVMPELARLAAGGAGSEIVDEVEAELQERWRRVIGLPYEAFGSTRAHHVTGAEIAERAAREFATTAPLWSNARTHAPDLMIVASGPEALAAGDVDFVLGELHAATNTLETTFFLQRHPEPDRLVAAASATGMTSRFFTVPRLDSPQTTTRMSRAAELMLPGYTYMCIGAETFVPPAGATVVSVLDLVAERDGAQLVVRHRAGGAQRYRFLEVIGEPLSVMASNAFHPFGGGRHRPRITIDRLVVGRESWTLPASGAPWAFVKDEKMRYAGARRWRTANGLPERVFVRVDVEKKPMACDFRSLPLVNLLAKSIRRTAESGAGEVTVTEMLPDADRLWLRDAGGRGYTAELRIIAVAPQ